MSLVDSMVRLEWASLRCEAEGGLRGLREAREHRRLYERLQVDFERTLVAKPTVEPKPPKPLNYKQHVARRDGASA